MDYRVLAQAYQDIEDISGNLDKIARFSKVLEEADKSEVDMVVALTVGKLHPDWKGEPEIGVAEGMAIQVVANAASVTEGEVKTKLQEIGDIGGVAEDLLSGSAQGTLFADELTVTHVFETLDAVAEISGKGSNKKKISRLVGLLTDAEPLEAKYILRTITGDLRLGLGDMSILDAMSVTYTGSRDAREEIERAYNVCSDIGRVARVLASEGIEAVREIHAQVGVPLRMMAAKKLSSATEIIEKAGGKVLVEYKYDGERVQVHKDDGSVVLFSRRQENITDQYPDVVEYVQSQVHADTCIIEAEIVAVEPDTGEVRPFQVLMQRRRKTDIEEMREKVPVNLFFFDVLFLDGEDVTEKPMLKRREILDSIIQRNNRVSITEGEVTEDPERLDEIFVQALDHGQEGVIAKAVHEESAYQAGSRSWLWIKLKASYKEGMADSVDMVVVGAIHGRGKRTGLYGAILASVYDEKNDTFPTACKIGTGFTDEMLQEFKERLEKHKITKKDPKVVSGIEADVWFEPVEVIEVLGDEITVSPTHPAAQDRRKDGGLAIRFPRFTGRWRDDKSAKQATTVSELIEMFEIQRGDVP